MTEEERIAHRKKIGRMIAEIRKSKGLTQEDLAVMVSFDRTNIAKIENGKYSVGVDVLGKICKALGVEIKIE